MNKCLNIYKSVHICNVRTINVLSIYQQKKQLADTLYPSSAFSQHPTSLESQGLGHWPRDRSATAAHVAPAIQN